MNPAIVAPDAFDIIDIGVDKGMTVEQRRNLGSITKVLQSIASGKQVWGLDYAMDGNSRSTSTWVVVMLVVVV